MLENKDENEEKAPVNKPLNLVMECIMTMVGDPVLNENKRNGETEKNKARIAEILAQFGIDRLLEQLPEQAYIDRSKTDDDDLHEN